MCPSDNAAATAIKMVLGGMHAYSLQTMRQQKGFTGCMGLHGGMHATLAWACLGHELAARSREPITTSTP